MFNAGPLFKDNYESTAKVVVNQGGTSSGKTYAIMQVLFLLAINSKVVITVAGQDIPNLKVGAMRDSEKIVSDSEYLQGLIRSFNKSDRKYLFTNGSVIEFNSYDNQQDAKSGKRDFLFVNEANGIDYLVYQELFLRTRKKTFIDYNPNAAFWVHDKVIGQPGVQLLISDHRHNPFLDSDTRDKIEALRFIDEEQWKVYARGITGKITGLVFKNFDLCNAIPKDATLIALGLDFGFTNDPTGLIAVYKQNGELWLNELLYKTGLTNTDIANEVKALNMTAYEIIADSAEPKSIVELQRLGLRVTGAIKTPGSINQSIDILKRYHINVTRNSLNLRNELMRYTWRKDALGNYTNEPIDKWNHLLDPTRYVALNKLALSIRPSARAAQKTM